MIKKKLVLLFIFFIISCSLYSNDNYYYHYLDKVDQSLYKEMESALIEKKDSLEVKLFDFDRVSNVYFSLLNDKPELFYVENSINYSSTLINDKVVSAKIQFEYKKDFNTAKITSTNSKLNYIKYKIFFDTYGFSDFEKVKACFDYLCETSQYDESVKDQSLYSVLIENKGVCASYAKAFKYLLDFFNIPNYIVEGKFIESNENHAWNLIKLDGFWYHVDVTQADSNEEYIDYSYFCTTEKQILKDHEIISRIPVFPTDSTSYFYLDNLGSYLRSFNKEKIKSLILNNIITNNNEPLIFNFAKGNDYERCLNYLLEEKNLFNIILNEGYIIENINYYQNNYTDTIIFIFDDLVMEDNLIRINNFSKSSLEKQIKNLVTKGNREIKLLFKEKEDLEKAKNLLLDQQYIFEIVEDIESINIINYEDIFRFDIKI